MPSVKEKQNSGGGLTQQTKGRSDKTFASEAAAMSRSKKDPHEFVRQGPVKSVSGFMGQTRGRQK